VLRDGDRLLLGDQELLFRSRVQASTAAGPSAADLRNAPTTALHSNRLTTILVVDIRDYTPLARTVSESLLSQTIGTWFLRSGQIAQRRGSWAQKYIGDAVMAVWIHDDLGRVPSDVRASLEAAVEIAAATAEISATLPLPAPLRIGAGLALGERTYASWRSPNPGRSRDARSCSKATRPPAPPGPHLSTSCAPFSTFWGRNRAHSAVFGPMPC
jgi:adenylate cyclase